MGLTLDVKTLLTSIDSNIYIGEMPTTPDNITCLFESGGFAPDLTHDGGIYQKPTFQVRVKDLVYATAIIKLEAIKLALCNVSNVTINGTKYLSIRQTSDIMPFGRDANNRAEFSINFVAHTSK